MIGRIEKVTMVPLTLQCKKIQFLYCKEMKAMKLKEDQGWTGHW